MTSPESSSATTSDPHEPVSFIRRRSVRLIIYGGLIAFVVIMILVPLIAKLRDPNFETHCRTPGHGGHVERASTAIMGWTSNDQYQFYKGRDPAGRMDIRRLGKRGGRQAPVSVFRGRDVDRRMVSGIRRTIAHTITVESPQSEADRLDVIRQCRRSLHAHRVLSAAKSPRLAGNPVPPP